MPRMRPANNQRAHVFRSAPYADRRHPPPEAGHTARPLLTAVTGDPVAAQPPRWRGRLNGLPVKLYVYRGSGRSDVRLDAAWKADQR